MSALLDIASWDGPTRAAVGVGVNSEGNAVLSGPALALREGLDQILVGLASQLGATDMSFSPLISASTLERFDWFRSFPHLATFATCLDSDEANIEAFCDQEPIVEDMAVRTTKTAPVVAVMSPAACYHLYQFAAGDVLAGPMVWTTRNTCCRHEEYFRPLERQWTFSMRELVFAGTEHEVRSLIEVGSTMAEELSALLDLPTEWSQATDPFFRGSRNPKHLFQQVDPVKHELVHDGRLAIASTNHHYDAIGTAFGIRRAGPGGPDVAAVTGCVAFGLERWVAAVIHRHGTDPGSWPRLGGHRIEATPSARPLLSQGSRA